MSHTYVYLQADHATRGNRQIGRSLEDKTTGLFAKRDIYISRYQKE